MTGGLPKGFWEDAYVLGFFSGSIGIFAKLSSDGRISGQDLGQVLIDSFSAISAQDGVVIADRVIKFQQSRDGDFLRGVTNADKIISVAYGRPTYDHDSDVIEAKRRATVMASSLTHNFGPSTPAAHTAGMLQQMLFYDVVRDRLGSRMDPAGNAP